MSRYSVAIVLLSLMAGGIVGIVYENARQGAAMVEGVTGTEVNAGAEAGTGDVALTTGRAGDAIIPARREEEEVAAGPPAARAVRRAHVAKVRADAPVRVSSRPAAVRSYVSVPRRESGGGGRNVAGHMAGGVKKTGAVVSKPFVKVGGLFHD